MSYVNERTNLLMDHRKPQYLFNSSIARERQRRIRQFQCCLCAIFLILFLVALVATVSYSIKESKDDEDTNSSENTTELLNLKEPSYLLLMSSNWPLVDQKLNQSVVDDEIQWKNAIIAGENALKSKNKIEENTATVPIDSPSYRHQKTVATSSKSRNLSQIGYKQEFAKRYLIQQKIGTANEEICYKQLINEEFCSFDKINCRNFQKFRTYNGSCNNLKYSNQFGVTYKPFRRALPPDYADGLSAPRISKNGKPLPSARTVSLIVHRPYYKDDKKFSVMLAVWGQFLDHDITATASSQGANGSTISCCDSNSTIQHPECFPVFLDPQTDPFSKFNISCMNFVRSAPAPNCCLGPRQQINQMSAFIDGSVIYGADENLVKRLRTMNGGELKMFITKDERSLLPISDDLNDGCNRNEEKAKGRYCFMTGDARSNENLHLTSMHLIWARHHNSLAKKLTLINPHWNDERIFQEVRKILGAQMQHITYNEFLPILLGRKLMEKFDLYSKNSGYFTGYNNSIDPSIANNFATAAFRFAHTIIPGLMKFLSNDTSSPEFIQLHKMLFDPFKLYEPGELDRTLRGAMATPIEASDPYFNNELKQHLFERNKYQCGLDLVSLNIQRGRDHGLVGYNSWREHCGLRRVRTFNQLHQDIDDDSLKNIQTIYSDVDDIDLYTGGLSEKPLNGSIIGPTITCLILDQFIRIKFGDRFWYETSEKPQRFTIKQLNEIRKTTLARVICDNSDNLDYIQPLVMENIRNGNENVACTNLSSLNLEFWRDLEEFVRIQMSTSRDLVIARN